MAMFLMIKRSKSTSACLLSGQMECKVAGDESTCRNFFCKAERESKTAIWVHGESNLCENELEESEEII